MNEVTVQDLIDALRLSIYSGREFLEKLIQTSDLSRPGLELTGYFEYYPADRVQVFGQSETSYLNQMPKEERAQIIRQLAQEETPALIFARNIAPEPDVLAIAEENGVPVLGSEQVTTSLFKNITTYLQDKLAPRISRHGVFVDVYGIGVLLIGDSGIGKSETALELIQNGNRLVADDRVDFYKRDSYTIVGESPELLRNMIEVRGLGIIDVMTIFGSRAVRTSSELSLILNLKAWNDQDNYERIGVEPEKVNIFGIDIPQLAIPVQMGRNISNIVEVAAMNFRARKLGYNSAKAFDERLNKLIAENKEKLDKQKHKLD